MDIDRIEQARAWAFEKLLQTRSVGAAHYQNMGLGSQQQQMISVSALIAEAETVAQWLWNGPDKPCEKCGK